MSGEDRGRDKNISARTKTLMIAFAKIFKFWHKSLSFARADKHKRCYFNMAEVLGPTAGAVEL